MGVNLYRRRIALERYTEISRGSDEPILSENPKTKWSINLPVLNCRPTRGCAGSCYACQGPISFPWAVRKALAVDGWMIRSPEWAARKTARESRGYPVRLAGSGDLTLDHLPYLREALKLGVQFFGFTRRPEVWEACKDIGIDLMFSVDPTMDIERLTWSMSRVPQGRRAYCRRPGDPDWSDRVGVTFPEHGSITDNVDKVPLSKTDCPAVRFHSVVCSQCRRCY